MQVVWSPIAEERAAMRVKRLWRTQRGVAWRWTQALLYRIGALVTRAARGSAVPELARRPRIAEIRHAPVRIIYRIDADRVVILTLRSSRKPLHDHQRDRHHHQQ